MARYICASCKRTIAEPSATMGAMSFGPRCAKRMGLLAAKNIAANARNTCARGRYFTENQMELFDADAGQLPACMEIK